MDIYFIRHGQTDGNVARRHQHPDIGLNEMGKLQAARVAKVARALRPTHLISSTQLRAMTTAKEIGVACDLIPETYPYFEELRRPRYIVGKRFYEWEAVKFLWSWFLGVRSASMHDGESYEDFRHRLALAKRHLEQLPERSRVVVVSHAVFIQFFLEHMHTDRPLGFRRALRRFYRIVRYPNTAVIHLRYEAGRWQYIAQF